VRFPLFAGKPRNTGMNATAPSDISQASLWNGPTGHAWVASQALLDRMFLPFQQLLTDDIPLGSALRVLDIGCGTGAVGLAAARRLSAPGHCLGIDLSEPMIALARGRAEREGLASRYVFADAQTYAFKPGGFDLLLSRFGVMFFDDPVAAHRNLRHAARAGAELRCVAWRGAAENPFMTTAERAAAALLPTLPPRRADGPGQFAFADRARVHAILQDAGWTSIEIEPIEVPCSLPESDLSTYLGRHGPLGLSLQDSDERTRARVIAAVRSAFDPYVHGDEVRYTAACWLLRARVPGA
jgi:ubiquinone/menaquinone biosynthesis C-methylase UbiE